MIPIKTPEEIAVMREGGRVLADIMRLLLERVAPGVSSKDLDREAERLFQERGAEIAIRGYRGFPGVICVSRNSEVVHGVPSRDRVIQDGDLVTLDTTIRWKGWHLDMARTALVGNVDPDARRLVKAARKALKIGIRKVRAGQTTGDVGNTIQRFVESQGFSVVRELCGHGIGRELHEPPQVPNEGARRSGSVLREGMTICVEPMITAGDWQVRLAEDGQTFITTDGSLSAHEEDTLVVWRDGCEVLTRSEAHGTLEQ